MDRLTRTEAIDKIKEWADELETIDSEADDFNDRIEDIVLSVRNNRLTYDLTTDTFNYTLKFPIKVGDEEKQMIEIKRLTVKQQKRATEIKSDGEKALQMLAYTTGLAIGIVERFDARDSSVINTVALLFFV